MNKERVKVWFDLENDWHEQETESLWAIRSNNNTFEIENVPFYVKGVSFRDIISAKKTDDRLIFESVLFKSGHSTYRIILNSNVGEDAFLNYWNSLEKIGCTYEKAWIGFYAIDVPSTTDIYEAYKLLEFGEKNDIWDFEEGDCGHQLN